MSRSEMQPMHSGAPTAPHNVARKRFREAPKRPQEVSTIAGGTEAGGTSTTDVGAAGQDVGDVLSADERDVAPGRALERCDGRARVDGVLEIAPVQHGPQEAGRVRVARPDGVDDLDGRPS